MKRKTILRVARVVVITGIFGAGYLCGSTTTHNANAQLGDVGGQLMKKAGGSGGMLGSAAQLGTTITDMEKHLDALQKNLGMLKKIRSALGG